MNPLVSPAWLAARLRNRDVVVLDATLAPPGASTDTHARYRAEHIPGAVFFDIEELSDHATPLPHMLPTPAAFSRSMSGLGVGDSMTIVVYEQENVFSAPRAWWMLRAFGARQVYLLDGDLQAWIDMDNEVESGEVRRPSGNFSAKLDSNAVKNFNQIEQMIAEHSQILDARSAGRFSGASPEPRPGLASGHMPGAINIPFTELVQKGRFKSGDDLRRLFKEAGVDLAQPVATTCGSGITAAVLALGLEMTDAIDISLYDGSWSEYAQKPAAVIETSQPGGE